MNSLADRRVLPVEIRLFLGKQMEIIFVGCFIILPRAATEERAPVVRRLSRAVLVVPRLPPDVPVAVVIVSR